jgi:hypothetical protein
MQPGMGFLQGTIDVCDEPRNTTNSYAHVRSRRHHSPPWSFIFIPKKAELDGKLLQYFVWQQENRITRGIKNSLLLLCATSLILMPE